jgi:hypothetical protein
MESILFVNHLQRKLFLPHEKAAALAKELIERFLPIKRYLKDFNGCTCSPSPLINAAWQELILFTKFYQKLCGKSFVHHNPMIELDDPIAIKVKRYAKTLAAYEVLFGAHPNDKEIWPVMYPCLEQDETVTSDEDSEETVISEERSDEESAFPAALRKRKAAPVADVQRNLKSPRYEDRTATTVQSSSLVTDMQEVLSITVQTLTGKSIRLINILSSDTIYDVKTMIRNLEGIPQKLQRLVFNGRYLENARTLSDYNIQNGAIVHLVLKLSGC